jgi:hypothetical protein
MMTLSDIHRIELATFPSPNRLFRRQLEPLACQSLRFSSSAIPESFPIKRDKSFLASGHLIEKARVGACNPVPSTFEYVPYIFSIVLMYRRLSCDLRTLCGYSEK